jgi:hypothetical protein
VCTQGQPVKTEGNFSLENGLPEDTVDTLIWKGVSSPVLLQWAKNEAKVHPHKKSNDLTIEKDIKDTFAQSLVEQFLIEQLPLAIRHAVLRFMQHLVELVRLELSSWFDAVLIFDLCYQKGKIAQEAIPVTCVAIVAMLRKADTATELVDMTGMAFEASTLADYLGSLGLPRMDAEVSARDVVEREQELLQILEWRINVTSVHKWLRSTCDRFNIISRGGLAQSLEWVFQQGTSSAASYLQAVSSCERWRPQQMANGLFCIGLIAARLLPLESMRPTEVAAQEWEKLFARSQGRQGPVQAAYLPAEHLQHMFHTLQVTTGCNIAQLRSDCYDAVLAMRDCVQAAAREPHAATTTFTPTLVPALVQKQHQNCRPAVPLEGMEMQATI